MKDKRQGSNMSWFYTILAFLACWYFYFSSSFSLRPFPQLFWVIFALLSIVLGILHKFKLQVVDLLFFFGMSVLLLLSVFSDNQFGSMETVGYYVIYYLAARMIAKNCKASVIHSLILLFSLVHLICIFIQILFPSVYISVLLPLLPSTTHNLLTEQMNWNKAYYGFTVQSSMSAMYLSIGAILSALRIENNTRGKQVLYIVLTVLFLVGTFYTQRRGSSVTLFVILVLIYMRAKGSIFSKILLTISIIALVVIVGIQNIPGVSGVLNKFQSYIAKGSLMNGRDIYFARALSAIAQSPLIGYGGGQVGVVIGYEWLENAYLSVLLQWGVIGAVFFFLPYVVMFRRTYYQRSIFVQKNVYLEFSIYIQILFFLMNFVENYHGEPRNIFILFLVVGASNEYCESMDIITEEWAQIKLSSVK